ncbi:hypothetical protein JCM8547_007468 [Rhodosporidiobolus lusitaniae]
MASNSDERPCYVCGVITTQRCWACQGAGFDLFFCSREHQKLVWFAHKRVCGENAKPFRFPLLSPDDFDQAKAAATYAFSQMESEEKSRAASVMRLLGESHEEVIRILNYLEFVKGCHGRDQATSNLRQHDV